jgi:hypothetical protein
MAVLTLIILLRNRKASILNLRPANRLHRMRYFLLNFHKKKYLCSNMEYAINLFVHITDLTQLSHQKWLIKFGYQLPQKCLELNVSSEWDI